MNRAFLLTGGNQGNREEYLTKARQHIEAVCGPVLSASSIYQTAAWGQQNQAPFLNQVLHVESTLSAPSLLQSLLSIEQLLGRKRLQRYGPRTIDIDILFYNQSVINTESLTVPHPQLQNRRFVLVPLCELAPHFTHPVLHKTVEQLLEKCSDPLAVQKI